jgi:hypothetical protein
VVFFRSLDSCVNGACVVLLSLIWSFLESSYAFYFLPSIVLELAGSIDVDGELGRRPYYKRCLIALFYWFVHWLIVSVSFSPQFFFLYPLMICALVRDCWFLPTTTA